MLNVSILSVIMLTVDKLNNVMQSVIKLTVGNLNIVVLGDYAEFQHC
jgi:hypothetical protein